MPWKCPACSTPIRRELIAAGHDTPEPARVYRCAICRLELVLSDDATRMVVAPFTDYPPCVACQSTLTDRIPFDAAINPLPLYRCVTCGHVWRDSM